MKVILLTLAAILASGCSFHEIEVEDASPMVLTDRAEGIRAQASRLPSECRTDRVDGREQSDGCRDVVRRGQ